MTKKTIITISGKPGSGKSTTGKLLAKRLSYKHASTGDFTRSLAERRGITLDELTKLAENDLTIDRELDEYTIEIGGGEKTVIDSRLGFHFIPDSFKVFLEIDHKIAAERIFKNIENNPARRNEARYNFDSIENISNSITQRLEGERVRYKKMYGITDHTAHENFDLVIHTDEAEFSGNVESVVAAIIAKYQNLT